MSFWKCDLAFLKGFAKVMKNVRICNLHVTTAVSENDEGLQILVFSVPAHCSCVFRSMHQSSFSSCFGTKVVKFCFNSIKGNLSLFKNSRKFPDILILIDGALLMTH